MTLGFVWRNDDVIETTLYKVSKKLYFARMAVRYKKMQNTKYKIYEKYKLYTDNKKIQR